MPRPPRLVLDGLPLHCIQRGNDRMPVFVDVQDRRLYRELLIEGAERFACAVHAYVLMTNHVHLLMTPAQDDAVARLTQWMGRQYVCRFNRRHGRTGTLWEGRFRSTVIDSARYFLTCSRYIDLNPVRAGLVGSAALHRWSSYGRLAHGTPDALVTEHAEYQRLGHDSASRQSAYRVLCSTPLGEREIRTVRRTVQRGELHGSRRFIDMVAARVGELPARLEHGGDRRSRRFRSADAAEHDSLLAGVLPG